MAGDVLIVAEHLEGRIAPSTFELISAGRTLADASGGEARVLVLGHQVEALARHLTGNMVNVLLADHPALAEYTGDAYVQAVRGVAKTTLRATSRCVSDTPSSALAARAAVMPGMIFTGMLLLLRKAISSWARPNSIGSPPLSRTTTR